MAIIDVLVPQLSESVSEATLLNWKKQPGDAIEADEILIDVETDKVVLEVPAPVSGVLKEIVKGDGSTVTSGEVLARIDTEGKATVAAAPAAQAAPVAAAAAAVSSTTVIASPAAGKILTEKGVDPATVEGTGRGGRITKDDAQQAGNAPAKKAVAPVAPPTMSLDGRPEQRVPMSRLRARVAERLLQSQADNAILTTFNEVNMQGILDLRKKYKDQFEKEHGVKLGFTSFFVKAAVAALKKYPVVNASVDGKDIIYHGYFDIGIAVGSPRGLVVPILRNADQMSIADIEKQIADFGTRARDGKLTLEELTGGTFSISNGGVFGSMLSTPIINPPQSAILGIHATKDRAVVENGQIVIRPMNYLAMSYDHRIIDGREAVLALVAIKEALEDPQRLLLDV
ncbi:MAG: 2-oxoglutarate dehydrogenase complex dihydrolipoyllysine-residue succinyltransferase [Burkholderiaceae bacterium]|nr:2-oxoglutarate dehydrogenase complex dihydrolipoyllysine-residue succinyltransferase [Burkholderiaceae bacterium]